VPAPKVIDFGIAKALEQKLTDKTLFTQFEQFIGTPAYTSPEQAEMSGLDIDTRSDIYSLGVLLYELLVGKTPFDTRDLLQSGLDEMRRIIREKEPARPSTRLSTMLAAERTTTAQRRAVSAPELIHLLRGDLDWIVMKCLEKDRTRRYSTANSLADDIEHYLSNEPVAARPPSTVYRFSKLVRRNKRAFAAGTTIVVALVAGTVVSTWQAARARRAEQVAREEKESAEAVLQFFRDKILAAGRPKDDKDGLGKDVTLRQAVDAAESQIAKVFEDRPLVEAAIRSTLGESYRELGEPALAVRQLERALALRRQMLGTWHLDSANALVPLASAYQNAGRPSEAVALWEKTFNSLKVLRGREHLQTIWSMESLALTYKDAGRIGGAVVLLEKSLALRKARQGVEHADTLLTMHRLADAYVVARKLDLADSLFRDLLRVKQATLGPEHPKTLDFMQFRARACSFAAQHDQAISLFEAVSKKMKETLGPRNNLTLWCMYEHGHAYVNAGRPDEAIPVLEELFTVWKSQAGPDHVWTLFAMDLLAWAFEKAGKIDQAAPLDEEILKLRRAKLGAHHLDTRESMHVLAGVYIAMGKVQQAEALYREALELKGDDLTATLGLARVLLKQAKADTANPARTQERAVEGFRVAREFLAAARIRYTNDVAKLEDCLVKVAALYYEHSQDAEAELAFRELVQRQRSRLAVGHEEVVATTVSLGRPLDHYAWAERTNTVAAEGTSLRSSGGPQPSTLYVRPPDRSLEDNRVLRERLAARLDGANQTHWRVGDVRSRLGGTLVSVAVTDPALDAAAREARLVEAETLLLQGNQRLQESKSAGKKYKRDALERLVRLYEAWNKPDQRSHWQQQLEDFDKAKSRPAEKSP
jgi:tetratricopeptide (TPR) repeat protein